MSLARANEILFAAVLAALGIGCVAGLYLAIALIPQHIPLDPNEGWNAYFAQAAMGHGVLYPPASSLMVNNYPPLSFYVVGTVGILTGDAIIAGRIVSLFSFFAVVSLIVVTAREMGASFRAALFGGLLFAGMLLVGSDYVGMDDPQLLGEAVALAGLFVLVKGPRTIFVAVASAALFVVAGFIKHNLIVMPLASAIWLVLYDRRGAVRFALAGAAFAALGLIVFRVVTGVSLLAQLDSARSYSWAAAATNAWSWLGLAFAPLAGAALLPVLDRNNPTVRFVVILTIIGAVAGYWFLGGAGVDVNAMFDADIALAFASALLLARLKTVSPQLDGIAAAVLAAPLAIALWLAWTPDWLTRDFWLDHGADDAATAEGDIAYLKAHPGPALCETLALCYWAGKKAEVDVFNMGEAYKTGARSDDGLVGMLNDKYCAAVQFETLSPFPLTPRVDAALMANYRVDHLDDDGAFLVPRK